MWRLHSAVHADIQHRAGDPALAALRVQVYYTVFDLDERYWVYNYNLFYRYATAAICGQCSWLCGVSPVPEPRADAQLVHVCLVWAWRPHMMCM